MEPRREEPQNVMEPSAERKPKRFRIIKLEDRIAPNNYTPHGTANTGKCYTAGCTGHGTHCCY